MTNTAAPARQAESQPDFVTIRPAVVLVALAGIAGVLLWGLAVKYNTSTVGFDVWLNGLHTPFLDASALAIAKIFSPAFAIVIGVLFAAVVTWRARSLAVGLGAGVAVGLGWGSAIIIKTVVHRARPNWALIPHHIGAAETDASFPSGHVTFVAALATVTVILLWRTRWRWTAVSCGALLVVLVAWARLYAGVHDLHDVGAGLVYGACASTIAFAFVFWLLQRGRLRELVDAPLARFLARE